MVLSVCPERLKLEPVASVGGAAGWAAGKVVEDAKSSPQALKRRDFFKGLADRLKSGPSQTSLNRTFSRIPVKPCTAVPDFSMWQLEDWCNPNKIRSLGMWLAGVHRSFVGSPWLCRGLRCLRMTGDAGGFLPTVTLTNLRLVVDFLHVHKSFVGTGEMKQKA
jgi:hypothetical protein